MEQATCELSAEKFDKAVHGGLDENPVLPSNDDLAFYFKPDATVGGMPMVVITFTVQLPDGSLARAQHSTTLALLDTVSICTRGWRQGGHL